MYKLSAHDYGRAVALEKLGIWGKLLQVGKRVLQSGVQNTGRKAVQTAAKPGSGALGPLGKTIKNYGTKAERGIAGGVEKVFGRNAGRTTGKLLQGTAGEMGKQTLYGAGFGGVIEGGLAAATAEDGNRLSAFGKGFGSGAMSGAAFGAASGAITGPARNLRKMRLDTLGKQQGLKGKLRQKAVNTQMNRGFFGSVKDAWKNEGPLGRKGAISNALAGPGQFGAETIGGAMLVPAALSGGGGPQPPQQPQPPQPPRPPGMQRTASAEEYQDDPTALSSFPDNNIKRLLALSGGSAATALPTGIGLDYMAKRNLAPMLSHNLVAKRGLPTIAGAIGAAAGATAGRHYFPDEGQPTPELVDKLEQLDLDKMMRYYKRKDLGEEPRGS